MNARQGLRSLARYLWATSVVLLICYAIIVVIGRQTLPYLERYQVPINGFFSQQLGIDVTTERITGSWTGLSPRLELRGLRLGAKTTSETFYIQRLSAELDLPRSLTTGELVWQRLSLGEIQIVVREEADGKWSTPGLPAFEKTGDEDDNVGFGKLTERLLRNRFIGIDKVSARLEFYSGSRATVNFDNMRLESSGDFHRLTADFALDDNPSSAQLLIEGRGNVLRPRSFKGAAYLRLDNINFSGSLRAIVARWFPELVARIGDIESELSTEIWLDSGPDGAVNLVGRLKADEIPLSWAADLPPIKNLNAELSGWFHPEQSWGLRWQGLDFDWADVDIQPLDLLFSKRLGARWGELTLAASQLNLATLTRVLTVTGLATGKTKEVVSTLAARGRLENLHLEIDLDEDFPLQSLRTRIDHLALNSWRGAPATRGLSGYLQWQGREGFFDIDSPDGFAMLYPQVYDDFMEHRSSRGRVNIQWQQESRALKIAGGPISIDDDREGQIRAYLSLDIPLEKGGIPEMWLLAGIRNSQSRYADQYIPTVLDAGLREWLDRAVGEMDVVEAGFIWRGSLIHRGEEGRSIQFYAKVDNGHLDYDPGWPALSDLSAYITVDGARLAGVADSARLGASEQVILDRARVTTRSGVPAGSGTLLSVIADITTPLTEGADILLASPLKNRFDLLADWRLAGRAGVHLELSIPLGSSGDAGQLKDGEHYRVEAQIKDGKMSHRDVSLDFDGISGLLGYSDERGLYSPGIHGGIWGQQLEATIVTAGGQTRLESEGQFDMAMLPVWSPLISHHVQGSSDYRVSFTVPEVGTPHLLFSSSLKGIASSFPEPLIMSSEQQLDFQSRIDFRDKLLVETRLGNDLSSSLLFDKGELDSGQIVLGRIAGSERSGGANVWAGAASLDDATLSGLEGLSIIGETRVLDLDAWLAAYQGFVSPDASDDLARPPSLDLSALDLKFSAHLGELIYRGTSVSGVDVTGRYNLEGLDVYLDSEILAGQIKVPTNEQQPLLMDLNYLTLPEPDLDSEESVLEHLEPGDLPHLSFATEGLRVGKRELGSLAFLMRPLSDGVQLSDIRAELTGIGISDLPDGESTTLTWREVGGGHQSRFSGLLNTYDLGAVLRAWQLPVVLNSKEAVAIVDLSWADKPWEFAVNKLKGQSALNFKDGNFFRAPGATSNAFIKLIGLINFHTWARRLRLDFSDLLASGIEYENLKGGLQFSEGSVAFEAPIVVDTPSGKMRMTGDADMVAETIDAHFVATLPVGTNLPWIVALAGGLPAAAGVYLTGKLFKKQVDRVSSLSYKITGPWSEPEIKVDKIFSDKTDG